MSSEINSEHYAVIQIGTDKTELITSKSLTRAVLNRLECVHFALSCIYVLYSYSGVGKVKYTLKESCHPKIVFSSGILTRILNKIISRDSRKRIDSDQTDTVETCTVKMNRKHEKE
jgi:hypothetical protein